MNRRTILCLMAVVLLVIVGCIFAFRAGQRDKGVDLLAAPNIFAIPNMLK